MCKFQLRDRQSIQSRPLLPPQSVIGVARALLIEQCPDIYIRGFPNQPYTDFLSVRNWWCNLKGGTCSDLIRCGWGTAKKNKTTTKDDKNVLTRRGTKNFS